MSEMLLGTALLTFLLVFVLPFTVYRCVKMSFKGVLHGMYGSVFRYHDGSNLYAFMVNDLEVEISE